MDENQTPTEAAAESYAVSADGLTYTFLLRKQVRPGPTGKRRLPLTIFSLPFSACSTRRRSLLPLPISPASADHPQPCPARAVSRISALPPRMTIRWSFLWNMQTRLSSRC